MIDGKRLTVAAVQAVVDGLVAEGAGLGGDGPGEAVGPGDCEPFVS